MIFKLYKILSQGTFNLSGLVGDFKKGPKGIIKSILLILLAIYLLAVMVGMYTIYMIGAYKYLAGNGMQDYMPFISMMVALMVIMFFGFTSVASSYYTGTGEEFLMSLPLSAKQFFGAKFAVSFVSDAVFGVGMFAIGSIVYGTTTELEVDGEYTYVGVRSNNGAIYLNSITFVWGGGATYTNYTTNCSGDQTSVDNAAADQSLATKVVRDGQVVIIRGNEVFNLLGVRLN